jgi:hypothetical protein
MLLVLRLLFLFFRFLILFVCFFFLPVSDYSLERT